MFSNFCENFQRIENRSQMSFRKIDAQLQSQVFIYAGLPSKSFDDDFFVILQGFYQ